MKIHQVSDADIRAISIVDKGANRKRFFLTKAAADGAEPLPGNARMVKAADWSAVYCVVAEPGAHEDPGLGAAAPEVPDVWASEDEIRKAAHRFMANGGLVNKMHESLEPYGQLVENAVALADFTVDGETIRKGSWYIAITPTDEGRAAIEKGEFTGVSIEGFARRELVEKAATCPECGYPMATGSTCGKCDEEVTKGSTRRDRSVGSVNDSGLLKRIADALVKRGDLPRDAVEKADRTFGEIIAQREFDEALPMAFDAFHSAVWNAFFPMDGESADPKALISESCDEFKAWALDMLAAAPVKKAEREETLAKAFGVDLSGSTPSIRSFDQEEPMDTETKDRFEKLETAQATMAEGITKLTEDMGEIAKAVTPEPEAPTVESVAESVAKLSEGLEGIKADIAKLGEGGSSQTDRQQEQVEKNEDAEQIRKAFEDEGVSSDLAGVL